MWAWVAAAAASAAGAPERPHELSGAARDVLARVCQSPAPGSWFGALAPDADVETTPMLARGGEVGERTRWVSAGAVWTVERIAPAGRLQSVRVRVDRRGDGVERPELLVLGDRDCIVRAGRQLRYEEQGGPAYLEHLDERLAPTGYVEPLNPPVPAADDPGGVPVALVDAGVNYLLPEIGAALARDGAGRLLGYDFWDMDDRPFDANPAGSPFFPMRHGTRTASLLLAEAPLVSLLPYRYPRPEMSRMAALVDAAVTRGARIVNLSLGSTKREEWSAFAAAAARHERTLFVASAGNDGLDIDASPVYPASLTLENLVVVSSAADDGLPAPGSNWGRRSVDLLVPAEQMIVTGFDGHARLASGSSYAAVRVSALAACLLGAHPDWGAVELKRALFALAEDRAGARRFAARGFIPDPVERARGLCAAEPADIEVREAVAVAAPTVPAPGTAVLTPSFVMLQEAGWRVEQVREAVGHALRLLGQCGIAVVSPTLRIATAPSRLRYYHRGTAAELVETLGVTRPTVLFVRDSLARERFDAHSFGPSNSGRAAWLEDTVWVMSGARDTGIAVAHELYHVLADSGAHSDDRNNLMHAETSPDGTALTSAQCERAIASASQRGLLQRAR